MPKIEVQRDALIHLLAVEKAETSLGVFPRATTRNGETFKRTEKQEGWNEALMAMSVHAEEMEPFLRELPDSVLQMIIYDIIDVTMDGGKPVMFVNCNDLFYWACADAEDITLEDIPDLERAISECPNLGHLLWCCRKRGMRPQGPFYNEFTPEEAALFDQAGPERDDG